MPLLLQSEFEGPILETAPKQLEPSESITPYVTDVSSDGVVTLEFSEVLTTSEDQFADATPTLVKRELSREVVLQNESGSRSDYDMYEAIEIMLSSTENEEIEPISIDWSLKSFNGKQAQLQMDLESIRDYNQNSEDYNTISISFNDAAGNFVSENGKGISFGQTIEWTVQPLVKKSVTDNIQALANLWMTLVVLALVISFFLAVFQGSLLPTWMLVNTLQLIAHVPLISSKLPSNAHYFLLNFLGVVRFNWEQLNSQVDGFTDKMSEWNLIESESSVYGAHLK